MDEKVKDIFNKFSLAYNSEQEKTASDTDVVKKAEDINEKLNIVINNTNVKQASSISLEELMILETV